MIQVYPNVLRMSTSGLITTYKHYFEKVQHNKIPDTMYRRTHNYFDYYYDIYKVIPVDENIIQILIVDKQDRDTKFLSLGDPLKKHNSFVNVHVPAKILRDIYKNHRYWNVEGFDKHIKSFFIIKRTVEEYNECVQKKADKRKRGN